MRKTYYVDMDLTFSAHVWVDAETEEEARQIALDKMSQDPFFRIARNGCFLDASVTDCFVDEDATKANKK
jgi:hypothetical protein